MKLARFRHWATALCTLLLPSGMCIPLLRFLGHRIGSGAHIGCSFIMSDQLVLQGNASIGHFNFISTRRVVLRREAYIGRGNIIYGPLSVSLAERAAIGNSNKIVRGKLGPVTVGPSRLRLGELSKITASHRIDCTASIIVGAFSTFAGTSSELWTHGYVHQLSGPGRYRIDGRITIGDNVYIGSSSIITAGVRICDGVIVGAGTTVAKNLLEPGLYVSAGIRKLERPNSPDVRPDLTPIDNQTLCERVYIKRSSR